MQSNSGFQVSEQFDIMYTTILVSRRSQAEQREVRRIILK